MTARPVILDCDPGQDDAVAILLALASPVEMRVLGVTCVAGNAPLDRTQRNARKVAELAGRPDLPVFAGCARPILRPLETAEMVHGRTGMDGHDLPEPVMPLQDRHAVDFIVDTCLSALDGEITLVATGPMTNLAVALIKEPRIVPRLREIVFMGGAAVHHGNSTPLTEFNVLTDPHAAQVVVSCGARVTMLGLDVTHRLITTPERLATIRAVGTPVAHAVADMLAFNDRFDIARYGLPGGPLHDPVTIAWLVRPELFKGRDCHVEVETASPLTAGLTVVDWWGFGGKPANVHVVTEVDPQGFYDLLVGRLARL
ncbi:MAG: nucleoside hydrolase [Alphaproteobacteria bacterium]